MFLAKGPDGGLALSEREYRALKKHPVNLFSEGARWRVGLYNVVLSHLMWLVV